MELLPLAQIAYNSAEHSATGVSPFRANYGFQPRMDYHKEDGPNPRANWTMDQIDKTLEEIKKTIAHVQEKTQVQANKKRIEGPILKEGDKVYLNRKNLQTKRPSDKLDFKKLGPFEITKKISDAVYELRLPEGSRVYPRFNIALLDKAPDSAELSNELVLGEPEFEVEEITAHRKGKKKQLQYLVKWLGYGSEDSTWEPAENLENSPRLLKEYWQRQEQRTGRRRVQRKTTTAAST